MMKKMERKEEEFISLLWMLKPILSESTSSIKTDEPLRIRELEKILAEREQKKKITEFIYSVKLLSL